LRKVQISKCLGLDLTRKVLFLNNLISKISGINDLEANLWPCSYMAVQDVFLSPIFKDSK